MFYPPRYLQEYTALGTAGGMYHFRDQILTGNPELFFVMNCDVCGDFPLREMLQFYKELGSNGAAVIMATEVCLKKAFITTLFTSLNQQSN